MNTEFSLEIAPTVEIYRGWKIGQHRPNSFTVVGINCFGCETISSAKHAIDIYEDGNTNPQCL